MCVCKWCYCVCYVYLDENSYFWVQIYLSYEGQRAAFCTNLWLSTWCSLLGAPALVMKSTNIFIVKTLFATNGIKWKDNRSIWLICNLLRVLLSVLQYLIDSMKLQMCSKWVLRFELSSLCLHSQNFICGVNFLVPNEHFL